MGQIGFTTYQSMSSFPMATSFNIGQNKCHIVAFFIVVVFLTKQRKCHLGRFLCDCCIHVSNMTQTKGHFTGFSTFYNFSLPETKQKAILQSLLPFTATVFNTRQKKSLFYNLIPSFSLSLQCETKQKATLQPL